MTSERSRLIDDWMPEYQFAERHRTRVRAPVPAVHRALLETEYTAPVLARLLLGLRALPARLLGRASPLRGRARASLRDVTELGFVVLEERPPHEIVLGLTGRFWQLSGGVLPTDPASFRDPPPPGSVRAAWSFELSPQEGDNTTVLSTETRVRCADAAARRAFGRYWLLIRPGSGLLRRLLLRAVRREAERSHRSARPG